MSRETKIEKTPNSEGDQYVLAKLALWAGDIDYALTQLDVLLRVRDYPFNRYPEHASIDVIGTAASRLRRQAIRLRGEIKRAARDGDWQFPALQPMVLIDSRRFVRATLWQREPRRFALLTYLSDLGMEQQFYRVIDALAETQSSDTASPRYDLMSAEHISVAKTSRGELPIDYSPTFAFEGNPFIEAQASDFGTIEAEVIWTLRSLPSKASDIVGPCESILDKFTSPLE